MVDPNRIDWSKYKQPSDGNHSASVFSLTSAYIEYLKGDSSMESITQFMKQIDRIYAEIYDKIETFKELKDRLYDLVAEDMYYEFHGYYYGRLEKVFEMFEQDYIDKQVVDHFCQYVEKHSAEWKQYTFSSPCAALVQSSGTGKTRLVKEAGEQFWLFYTCCRSSDTSDFPFCSSIVSRFTQIWFQVKSEYQNSTTLEALHVLFLAACLNELSEFIKEEVPIPDQKPAFIDKMYLVKWRQMQFQLSGTDKIIGGWFWDKIWKRFRSLWSVNMPETDHEFRNVASTETADKANPKNYSAISQNVLENAANSLQDEIALRCTSVNHVLFAYDEAHELKEIERNKQNAFNLIRCALGKLPDGSMCLSFLSSPNQSSLSNNPAFCSHD